LTLLLYFHDNGLEVVQKHRCNKPAKNELFEARLCGQLNFYFQHTLIGLIRKFLSILIIQQHSIMILGNRGAIIQSPVESGFWVSHKPLHNFLLLLNTFQLIPCLCTFSADSYYSHSYYQSKGMSHICSDNNRDWPFLHQ